MLLDQKLREQLIEQARKIANERRWTFQEPIELNASTDGKERVWIIRSNAAMRGQNAQIILRQSDHSLLRADYLPR
jgi:hypothetical protein